MIDLKCPDCKVTRFPAPSPCPLCGGEGVPVRPPGRPPLGAAKRHKRVLYLSDAEQAEHVRAAEAAGLPLGVWRRQILSDALIQSKG